MSRVRWLLENSNVKSHFQRKQSELSLFNFDSMGGTHLFFSFSILLLRLLHFEAAIISLKLWTARSRFKLLRDAYETRQNYEGTVPRLFSRSNVPWESSCKYVFTRLSCNRECLSKGDIPWERVCLVKHSTQVKSLLNWLACRLISFFTRWINQFCIFLINRYRTGKRTFCGFARWVYTVD